MMSSSGGGGGDSGSRGISGRIGAGGDRGVGRAAARRRASGALTVSIAAVALLVGCATFTPSPDRTGSASPSATETDSWTLLMHAAPGLDEVPDSFEQPGASGTTAPGTQPPTTPPTGSAAPDQPAKAPPVTIEVDAQTPPTQSPGATADPTAPADPATASWSTTNVGLSFESQDLADLRWEPGSSTLDLLIGSLDRPSLRFGGNSIDRRVWWTSSNEPAPDWAEVTITPNDLDRLARFADEVDATVTLALDLGHDDPDRAADMAAHARAALGDRLQAVAVGNEPNGFFLESQPQYAVRDEGWSPEAYAAELRDYQVALAEAAPDVPIAGPGAFDAPWWRAFVDADLPNTAALAQHWYPLWSCAGREGSTDERAAPTPENLASPWLHDRAATIIGMASDTAGDAGLPLWMEETGPTSCTGSNDSSRTHAQALWTVDYALHAASLGVSRLNFHAMIDACWGGAPMSALCDLGDPGSASPELMGQSNYLGLLLASWVRPGSFVPVTVSGDDRVFAYAVQDATGFDLVVVNVRDPLASGGSPLTLSLPDGASVAEAAQLSGESLDAFNDSMLVPLAPASAESVAQLQPGTATLLRVDMAGPTGSPMPGGSPSASPSAPPSEAGG
ncbi:MAG: hypothetical protein ACTH31_00295 [Pseudoclavibacter sp.]